MGRHHGVAWCLDVNALPPPPHPPPPTPTAYAPLPPPPPRAARRISKSYSKNNQRMPPIFVKAYTYQMCRALGHIHK
jgi:hypothetical protein